MVVADKAALRPLLQRLPRSQVMNLSQDQNVFPDLSQPQHKHAATQGGRPIKMSR